MQLVRWAARSRISSFKGSSQCELPKSILRSGARTSKSSAEIIKSACVRPRSVECHGESDDLAACSVDETVNHGTVWMDSRHQELRRARQLQASWEKTISDLNMCGHSLHTSLHPMIWGHDVRPAVSKLRPVWYVLLPNVLRKARHV